MRCSDGVQHQEDFGHTREKILASDGVCDAHVSVVHCVGQQEHRRAVGPPDYKVLEVVSGKRNLAPDNVVEGHGLPGWHPESHSQPVYQRGPADLAVLGITQVGQPTLQKVRHNLAVAFLALGLEDRSLVPVQAQPLQLREQVVGEVASVALGVGVLDSQHVRSAHRAGVQPVEQGRPSTADV